MQNRTSFSANNGVHVPTHGFALLTTLATILLLATLVLTVQTRSQSNLRLLGRLTADLQDRAAKDSLHDRLRGLVADSIAAAANPGARAEGRPALDGTPFALREGGKDWVVRVQDVEGQGAAPRFARDD